MPIFPQYGGVSTGIPQQNLGSVEVPTDPMGKQIERLGNAGEAAVSQIGQAQQRMQQLQDEAAAQQRYMQAVMDMEGIHESLNVPANAMQGKALFEKGYAERQPEWYKGLTPGASSILQKKLFPKSLEYKVGAAKLENRAKLEDYNATMVRAESWYADAESRRIDPSDASESSEYRDYAQMVDAGVAAGYIQPTKGEEMKDAALKHGAYSRAYKVTVSDSQEEIKNLQKIYAQEKEKPGSTFLKHMDPDKRVSTEKMLDERLRSLESEEQRKIRQAKQDTKEMNDELSKATATMAQQKLDNPEKYGALTGDWLDLAADLRLLDDRDLRVFRGEVNQRAQSGTATGYDNPETFKRLSGDGGVYDTRSPEHASRVRDEVKNAMANGQITTKTGTIWLNHLEEKTKATSDPEHQRRVNMVKDWAKRDLVTSGPMQAIKDEQRSVLSEAIQGIDTTTEDPVAYYEARKHDWMARAGISARVRGSELRRSMGLPPTADPKIAAETLEQKRIKLREDYKAAPQGPDGDAIRDSIGAQFERLKELDSLERATKENKDRREESKAAKQSIQQSGSSAPQLGPRR